MARVRSTAATGCGELLCAVVTAAWCRRRRRCYATDIEGRRELYRDIFSRVSAAGVDPAAATTQLAWDFTVMTRSSATARQVFMRDDGASVSLLATSSPPPRICIFIGNSVCVCAHVRYHVMLSARSRVGPSGPSFTVDSVTDMGSFRVIMGNVSVPSYLSADRFPRIVVDASGTPVFQGLADVPYVFAVPLRALTSTQRVRIMHFGHGYVFACNA